VSKYPAQIGYLSFPNRDFKHACIFLTGFARPWIFATRPAAQLKPAKNKLLIAIKEGSTACR
jgi:hypothetical protein